MEISKHFMTIYKILTKLTRKSFQNMNIFGDFQLNLLCRNKNIDEFVNLMLSFSLLPVILRPTRITDSTASLLDHIWTSQWKENAANYLIDADITDHFPVVSVFNTVTPIQCNRYTRKRAFTPKAIQSFSEELALKDWNDVMNSTCSKTSFDAFYCTYISMFEKHFPIKLQKSASKYTSSEHVTTSLRVRIKEKNRRLRLSRKWPDIYSHTYKNIEIHLLMN